MSTKELVLKALEENRGIPVSGGRLAESLKLSRGAVWKAIESLREQGYRIEAVSRRGYTLSVANDLLSAEGILPHLMRQDIQREQIFVYKTVESTNQLAKKMAVEGAGHGTILLAEEQTNGRGRLGRSFYSPSGTGLYMSVLLRPTGSAEQALTVTTTAAVAVCRALEKTYRISPGIKWVNDIFYQDRKICGILAEAVSDFQTGTVESLILGIGINIYPPEQGFPEELKRIAGTVIQSDTEFPGSFGFAGSDTAEQPKTYASRNHLAAALIDQLMSLLEEPDFQTILVAYKERCFILGDNILVIRGDQTQNAKALDIDSRGGLVVEMDDGSHATLRTGEISIRSRNGF